MTVSKPSEPTYPRSVTPGIETHMKGELEDGTVWVGKANPSPPGLYANLDWIRFTGPAGLQSGIEMFLCERFGTEPRGNSGAKWFQHGMGWEPGVMLSWGHKSHGILQVDIQGQRLRMLGGAEQVNLLKQLMYFGLKPTRLDGAIDWIGQSVNLWECATDSCKRGELCIMRKYGSNDGFTAQGYPTRRHLSLGSRESPVCARVYDKGLEQGAAPVGYWERLEVEWKSDRAPEVARVLLESGDNWPDQLFSLVLGALDFREDNGRSELARRPVVAWWSRLIEEHETVRIAPAQKDESFERWQAWVRRACAPRILEMAAAVGEPVASVFEWLIRDAHPRKGGGVLLEQFKRAFRESTGATGGGMRH